MRKNPFFSSSLAVACSVLQHAGSFAALSLLALLAACSSVPFAPADDAVVVEFTNLTSQSIEVKKLDGATVSGIVSLYVRDNPRLTEVRFYVDDPERMSVPLHIDSEAPFTMDLDTRELADGDHRLSVAARVDRGGDPSSVHAFVVANGEADPAVVDEPVTDGGSTEEDAGTADEGTDASEPVEEDGVVVTAATLYVAPYGDDANDGRSVDAPLRSLQRAADLVQPGDVVHLRGGVYPIDVRFTRSGTEAQPITWASYPGEWAVLDGSDQTPVESGHRMRVAGASWNVFTNFEVRYGPQEGIFVEHSHDNVFRGIVTHGHHYSGIGNVASDRNLYESITTYDNYDRYNPYGREGDDADGIALSSGDANVLRRIVAYNNSDDGVDAWRSTNTRIENVVAYGNGRGTHGNGNGIKAGGNNEWNNTVVRNSIAFQNRANGFDDNSGLGILFENNTAYHNGGYSFMGGSTTTRRNNIAVGGTVGMWGAADQNNTWNLGIGDPLFASTDMSSYDFMSLQSDSPAIASGYDGSDLGAIPYATTYADLVGSHELGTAATPEGDTLALR